jgi:hypothetical protein
MEKVVVDMITILLNDRPNTTFGYSEEFKKEYEKEGGIWDEIKDFRTDELIIEIYERLGSEKSSGNGSYIIHTMIPVEFKDGCDIDIDTDGSEIIRINILKIIKNKIDLSEENMKELGRILFILNNITDLYKGL